jgi:formylglycine-generating enzyme required for sulfatase activity
VSKYALTFADWDECVTGGGCSAYRPHDQNWGRGTQPIINVNWNDAQQYVTWLSAVTGKTYRLLSESEYEYVTRAGNTTNYPWGNDIRPDGQAMANCDGCGSSWDKRQTAPVESFLPNKFGLYNMVGNVWEWVEDCWHDNYEDAPSDGSAWTEASSGICYDHVARGGSWFNTSEDLHSAARMFFAVGARSNDLGFRVARTLAVQ